ncbi:hypothetical protein AB3S75_030742 [Citrus x aurantiifolia]
MRNQLPSKSLHKILVKIGDYIGQLKKKKCRRKEWKNFQTKVNKNLPWKQVLEFGCHVFDPTRTPSDLKDKWRNIMAKESSAAEDIPALLKPARKGK